MPQQRNGNGNGSALNATLRRLAERLNLHGADLQKVKSYMQALGSPQALMGRLETLENCRLSFKEKTIREAAWTIPFYYVIDVALPAVVARTPGNVNISQWGWFFCERIFATFRVTAAGAPQLGRFRPISSGNPIIAGNELVAGAFVVDGQNFLWELTEGRAQRDRQDNAIPGDILYRIDGDGFLPGGDAYGPNAVVQVQVTPTVAPANAGTMTFVLCGIQCLDVTGE